NSFTVAASADAFLTIPVINKSIRLGGGFLLYQAPGLLSFGGGLDEEFFGVIRIVGYTQGDFNFPKGKFNLFGNVRSCIADIPLLGDLCYGSVADISDIGAGGCVDVGPVSVGGGIVFRNHDISLWPLDGCKWSPFADQNVFARAAQAGDPV